VAVFSQRGGFTCGALGYFVSRLADRGLVGLAATNGGPAFLAASGADRPVFCTNPMAFAAPRAGAAPLVIDQSSSATAFVNLVRAAEAGEPIPEGWALDTDGRPTTDPMAAMQGVLLAFGGARGANVALMVEVLAAGLSGANWSLDAPSFLDGEGSPGVGLFVLALDADLLLGGEFAARLGAYLERIERDFGAYVPGARRAAGVEVAQAGGLSVERTLHERLRNYLRAGANV
jgi:(2R)-3-sulfolactate dehydrogenase (NADP+)